MADLVGAAGSGDRVQALVALRDLLAVQLVAGESRGLAALAHEFRETLRDLSAVSVPEGDEVDELSRARAARRSGAEAI